MSENQRIYLELRDSTTVNLFIPGGVSGMTHHVTLPLRPEAWATIMHLLRIRALRTQRDGGRCLAKIGEPESPTQRLIDEWLAHARERGGEAAAGLQSRTLAPSANPDELGL